MLDPLRDMQDMPPTGYCARCGGEIYAAEPDTLCSFCAEEMEEEDETV